MSGLPAMVNSDGLRKVTQIKFGGYDHNAGAAEGSFWDMENLSGDEYPVLTPRRHRYRLKTLSWPGGLAAHDGLYWVDGTFFFRDGVKKGNVEDSDKTFVSLGAYLLIFPDKKYYHSGKDEFGSLEVSWSGRASFGTGTFAEKPAAANTITTTDGAFPFVKNEGVTISGCGEEQNNKIAVVREVSEDKKTLRFYENSFSPTAWTGTVTLKREVPELDFACSNENRVWGCKGDTIYCSALGNPMVWNNFDTVATACFAADVGSAGDFTACCSYLGYPVFFKEDQIYKVYGNKPSNFQIMGSASLGVEQGSHKSLAVAGERLFYLSRSGVVSYSGGMPEVVSRPLGKERYKNGAAGSDGLNYYISLENGAGEYSFFTFDTRTGLWHREDNSRIVSFAWDGELYFLDSSGCLWLGGNPRRVPDGAEPDTFASAAEFGDFTENSPDKKGVGKLQLRAELEPEAELAVLIQYDSSGEWEKASVLKADRKRSFVLPVIPRRCDHYRVRLEGTGEWRLYSLAREFYSGSEI